jgi:hypothetical protein
MHAFMNYVLFDKDAIYVKPDHKNKKPRHVAENPWN